MGSLLLSQQLHDEPVLDISTQSSLLSQYYNKSEKNEDIHILYKTVVCSIIGFVLLNTMNACRNQLARGMWMNFFNLVGIRELIVLFSSSSELS